MNQTNSFAQSRVERRGNFLFLALLTYLFLFFFRPFDQITWLQALHLPMLTGGFCLLAYVSRRLSMGQSIVPVSPITNAIWLLTIWILFTLPFSFWISGSVQTFWDAWVKMIALYILLANIPQSARQIWSAVWICVVGATGVSVIAVALRVLLGESVAEGRLVSNASGLYSGPNFFAMTLILLLPYVLFTFFITRRPSTRLFAAFVIAIFTIANLMTESRGGLLVETFVVVLVVWRLGDWGISRTKTVGVMALGAMLLLPLAPAGLWQRFSALFSDADVNQVDPNSTAGSALLSLKERQQLLLRAVIITVENPVFGVGMNNFPAASHQRFDTGDGEWLGCHDTFLQLSAELGIPGLLLHLFLLYATFKSLRQLRRSLSAAKDVLKESTEMRLAADATMASFWGYVVFSIIAHLGYQPYFFVVAGIGQGLINLLPPAYRQITAAAPLTPVVT
jgi:putative inorganic carbon (HCO3(-)) transporter